ncbi:MAG: hypothetical protein M1828_000742 [Chrysothrix sp. TS-e1954]|nr:MAG: hypothetical protein M1828_000742 [Chrysothrix sp. TS-e1954]
MAERIEKPHTIGDLIELEQPPERVTPPAHCFEGKCTEVNVGPGLESFYIHKELLCYFSDFFVKALEGSFREATSNNIDLEEDNVEVFRIFNLWLYSGIVAFEEACLNNLCGLWIFASKYGIPRLQDSVMTTIIRHFDKTLCNTRPDMISFVFSNTVPSDRLRRLLLYTLAMEGETAYLSRLSREVIIEIATVQTEIAHELDNPEWYELVRSKFYESPTNHIFESTTKNPKTHQEDLSASGGGQDGKRHDKTKRQMAS